MRATQKVVCQLYRLVYFASLVNRFMTNLQKAEKFWTWFSKNNHTYLFLNDVDNDEKERLINELLKKLHQYSKHLFFEIGVNQKNGTLELTVTADGRIKYFPKVDELVDAAPAIQDWQFTKFRQPNTEGFILEYSGKTFDPSTIIYIPLYNKENPTSIGIRICYPDFTEEDKTVYLNGTYIMLDNILGEKSSVLDIDYLEVVLTPAGISEDDYEYLSDVGKYIKERKYFKYPGQNFDVIETFDAKGNIIFTTANFAYLDFNYKNDFPWFLRITIQFNEFSDNGQPSEEESSILNEFEDFLETEIKEVSIVHYIGRSTYNGKRDILYYLDNAERASLRLTLLASNPDPVRAFHYNIENDSAWANVAKILNGNRSKNSM